MIGGAVAKKGVKEMVQNKMGIRSDTQQAQTSRGRPAGAGQILVVYEFMKYGGEVMLTVMATWYNWIWKNDYLWRSRREQNPDIVGKRGLHKEGRSKLQEEKRNADGCDTGNLGTPDSSEKNYRYPRR